MPGRLASDAKKERAIVFVSHNLQMIRGLCTRIIHLENGCVHGDYPIETGITEYSRFLRQPRDISGDNKAYRLHVGNGAAMFTNFMSTGEEGDERWRFRQGENVRLKLSYKVERNIPSLGIHVIIRSTITGEIITTTFRTVSENAINSGYESVTKIEFPQICLRPGDYALSFQLTDKDREKVFDLIDEHVDVPWLSIDLDAPTLHPDEGYFTLPNRILNEVG